MTVSPGQAQQCRHCIHPLTTARDARGEYWVHADTGLVRCPFQPARRRQVADPVDYPITRAMVTLAGSGHGG